MRPSRHDVSSLFGLSIDRCIREQADANPGLRLHWVLTRRLVGWSFGKAIDDSPEERVEGAWRTLQERITEFIALEPRYDLFLRAAAGKWAVREGWGDVSNEIPGDALHASDQMYVFHAKGCPWIAEILPQNLFWFASIDQAEAAGFRACLTCVGDGRLQAATLIRNAAR